MASPSRSRLILVAVFVAALLAVLAGRLIELAVVRGPALARAAQDQATRTLPQPAPRGLILDASGRPLAGNTAATGVLIDRQVLAEQDDGGERVLAEAARLLGISAATLRGRLTPCGTTGAPPRPLCDDGSPGAPVSVLGRDPHALLTVAENPRQFAGVTLTAAIRRTYPQPGVSAGHLLGFLGATSADDLAAHPELTAADRVGRGGLEQQYDAMLRGTSGERGLRVNARGEIVSEADNRPAVPGQTLVTSIDARLQAAVEESLSTAIDGNPLARAGAAVLDARTGRVLALASKPDFEPQAWVDGVSQRQYRELSDAGALVDYSLSAPAPPGSIFKPFTVLGMARAGFGLDDAYDCPSDYTAGGRTFSNFESKAYGTISLSRALEISCNTVFYRAADRLWRRGGGEHQGPGTAEPISQAGLDAGLGDRTGVDLPAEAGGRVSSPTARYELWEQQHDTWCSSAEAGYPELRRTDPARADFLTRLDRENCRSGHLWRQGDAINAGIGQGETSVTVLQMAVAYAAIANGGTVWQPSVARALLGPEGQVEGEVQPVRAGSLAADRTTLRFLRAALAGVPRSGTAAEAFAGFPLDRFPVAGKTGSAQVEGEDSTSWFASFAPADRPRYVVVVMVTHGGTGATAAAPAARAVYEAIFGVGRRAVFDESGPPQALPQLPVVSR